MKVSYKYTVLFIFLFANFNLFATKYTWTGNTSIDWSTSTNWSPNGVPSTTDSVKIVTRTNAPVLAANTTVKELDMTSGSISLGGYSLTVSNNAYFYAGTLSNGTLVLRGSNAIFNGSTLNVTLDAIVARVEFSGGVFNYQSSFEQTGASTTNGAGGCTFNAPITIKKSGGAYLTMGVTSADIFNSTLKVINTATYAVQLGYNTVASFYDSLILENSSASGISIGGGNANGGGHIYNGKKIAIGTGGFTAGLLTLKNFIQTGTGQQSFVTTGSAITSLAGCSFEGDLTITSPGILLKTSTFNGTTEFIRSSTSSSYNDGGNTFNGTTTFRNNASNTASFRLGVQTGDQYNGNVSFITTTGYIQPAYSGTSEFKGNVSISSALVVFNVGTGKLLCTGTNNQTFSTTGSLTYLVSKFGINKSGGSVTFNAPITIDSLLELTSGNIVTSSTNLLTLKVAASVSGGSLNSYVAGPVKKIGNTIFKFPVGKGTDYRPVSITAPSNATDAFILQYFDVSQNFGNNLDTNLMLLDTKGYYDLSRISGTSSVRLTLENLGQYSNLSNARLTKWSTNKWISVGNYNNTDSTISTLSTLYSEKICIAYKKTGDVCSNSIYLSGQSSICDTIVNLNDTILWFSFLANGQNEFFELSTKINGSLNANIYSVSVYSGSCNSFTLIKNIDNIRNTDSTLKFQFATNQGDVFYIKVSGNVICSQCTQGISSKFRIKLTNLTPSSYSFSYAPSNCNLIKNSDFSNLSHDYSYGQMHAFDSTSSAFLANQWQLSFGANQIGRDQNNNYYAKSINSTTEHGVLNQAIDFDSGGYYIFSCKYKIDTTNYGNRNGLSQGFELNKLKFLLTDSLLTESNYSIIESGGFIGYQLFDTVDNISNSGWKTITSLFKPTKIFNKLSLIPQSLLQNQYVVICIDSVVMSRFNVESSEIISDCKSRTIQLDSVINGNCQLSDIQYLWSPGKYFNDSTLLSPSFNSNNEDSVSVSLKIYNQHSEIIVDSIKQFYLHGPEFNLVLQHDYIIQGDSIFIYLAEIQKGKKSNYLWNTGSHDTIIIATAPGNYELTLTDSNYCSNKKSVFLSPSSVTTFTVPTNINLCSNSDSYYANGSVYVNTSQPIVIGVALELMDITVPGSPPLSIPLQSPCSNPFFKLIIDKLYINNVLFTPTVQINPLGYYELIVNSSSFSNGTNVDFALSYSVILDCDLINSILPISGHTIVCQASIGDINQGTWSLAPNASLVGYGYFGTPNTNVSFNANYNSNSKQTFYYQNTGNAQISINFEFEDNLCPGNTLGPNYTSFGWQFGTNSTAGIPSSLQNCILISGSSNKWGGTIVVPAGDYLVITRDVVYDKCISDCYLATSSVVFNWRCSNSALSCTTCPSEITTNVSFVKENTANYTIQEGVFNNSASCLGSSNHFDYLVSNNSMLTDYQNLTMNLHSNITNNDGLMYLIDNSIVLTKVVSGNPILLIEYTDYILINTVVDPSNVCLINNSGSFVPGTDNLLSATTIKLLKDFDHGSVINVAFNLYKCCSENATLFNENKVFNHWTVDVSATDVCGNLISPTTGSGTVLASPFSLSPNANTASDLDLSTNFIGIPSSIIVPPGTPPQISSGQGYVVNLQSVLSGVFDLDIFNATLDNSLNFVNQVSGLVKVEIHTNVGLVVDPSSISQGSGNFYFINNLNANRWYPFYASFDGVSPTGLNCQGPATLILYFNLADLSFPDYASYSNYFTNSDFQFELKGCCGANASGGVNYTVSFSVLPNSSCFAFSPVNIVGPIVNSPLVVTSLPGNTSCWIPLVKHENVINIQCPGCISPGVSINSYKIERTTFGLVDNYSSIGIGIGDNAADLPVTIASESSGANVNMSMYGDILVDHLMAQFDDGDPTATPNPGYNYGDCMIGNNPNNKFKTLQFLNTIPYSNSNDMDLEVESLDFYIEEVGNTGQQCVDCAEFDPSYSGSFKTILHLHSNDGSGFNVKGIQNDDRFLFTFEKSTLISPSSNSSYSISQLNGGFTEFLPYQRFRLKVNYKVKGGITNNSNLNAEKTSNIQCELFLTGEPLTLSNVSVYPEQPPTEAALNSDGHYCQTTADNFVNDYKFICTKGSTNHFFVPISIKETSGFGVYGTNSCENKYKINAIANTGLPVVAFADNFVKEYRPTPLWPTKISFNVPKGFRIKPITASNTYNAQFYSNCYFISTAHPYSTLTKPFYFAITPVGSPCSSNSCGSSGYEYSQTVTLDLATQLSIPPLSSNLSYNPFFNCYSGSTPFFCNWNTSPLAPGDDYNEYVFEFDLEPCDCNDGVSSNHASPDIGCTSDVTFDEVCMPFITSCNVPSTPINPQQVYNSITLPPIGSLPNPNLVFNFLPTAQDVVSNSISWDLNITNNQGIYPNNNYTSATNAFIRVPTTGAYTSLTNWKYTYTDAAGVTNTLFLNSFGYFDLTYNSDINIPIQSSGNPAIIGTLSATFASCIGQSFKSIPVVCGWNCNEYPSDIYPNLVNSCGSQTINLELIEPPTTVVFDPTLSSIPNEYIMCGITSLVSVFKTNGNGGVYPKKIIFDYSNSLYNGLSNAIISISSGNGPYVPLTLIPGSQYEYEITTTNLSDANFPSDYILSPDRFYVKVEYYGACKYNGEIPEVELVWSNYCGVNSVTEKQFTSMALHGTNCSDCYSIAKNCMDIPYAIVGENYTYEFTIYNYSTNAPQISLTDLFPSFTYSGTFPSSLTLQIPVSPNGYTTYSFSISGFFTSAGLITNEVTATLNGISQTASCTQLVENSCASVSDKIFTITNNPLGFIESSSFTNNVVSNQKLYFKIDLEVDQDVTFDGCTIYMDPGTSILVNNSRQLILDNTQIVACSRMWKGVKLLGDAVIQLKNHSVISGAEYGIELSSIFNTNFVDIEDSYIKDCYINIYVPELGSSAPNYSRFRIVHSNFGMYANSLALPYFGQLTTLGSKPKCAFEFWNLAYVNDIGDLNSGTSNTFYNCNAGIVAFRCLALSVLNNSFVNIKKDATFNYSWSIANEEPNGCAVSSIGDNTVHIPNLICKQKLPGLLFQNCDVGVFTKKSNAKIESLRMINMERGIYSTKSSNFSVSVSGCYIKAKKYGIDWLDNTGAVHMDATSNVIIMDGANYGTGINIGELTLSANGKYNIASNYIELYNASYGIHANVNLKPIITSNSVHQYQSPFSRCVSTGIQVDGCDNSTVTCNSVTAGPGSFCSNGYRFSHSASNTIECNTSTENDNGFVFKEANLNTSFKTNIMDHNKDLGLKVYTGAAMGDQIDHGNKWIGFGGNIGAKFINPVFGELINNQFYTLQSGIYWPNLDLIINSNWFFPTTNQPLACSNLNCVIKNDVNLISNMDKVVATDSSQYDLKFQLKSKLYEKIYQDNSLLQLGDTSITSFYNENSNSDLYYYSKVNDHYKSQINNDSLLSSYYEYVIAKGNLYIDSIRFVDSLNTQNQLNGIGLQTNPYKDSLASLSVDYLQKVNFTEATVSANVDSSSISVSYINADELPALNFKTMAEIYNGYYKLGISVLKDNVNLITDIAMQCPRTGGVAVFIARNFVRLLNIELEYDDDANCGSSSRISTYYDKLNQLENFYTISPNPTQLHLTLRGSSSSFIHQVILIDLNGKEIIKYLVDEKIIEKSFDLPYLSDGVYNAKIILENGKSVNKKVVILN